MNGLDTYNQVNDIEAKGIKRILLFFSILFVLLCVVAIIALYLQDSSRSLLLASSLVPLLLSILMLSFAARKKPKCRYCGRNLDVIQRPFQFKYNHLFGRGLLIDGEAFMPSSWRKIPFRRQWVKLYHWSFACHNCRIYEKKYHEASTPVSDLELDKIEEYGNKVGTDVT